MYLLQLYQQWRMERRRHHILNAYTDGWNWAITEIAAKRLTKNNIWIMTDGEFNSNDEERAFDRGARAALLNLPEETK